MRERFLNMTMFQDSVNKKMYAIDREGQYLFDFGHAEKEMVKCLTNASIALREGASDEKDSAIGYVEYLADCLKTGKLQVKWNIS